jgi:hypothetical protein
MTTAERDRRTRRVFLVALGISAAAHVAALAWLGLPVRLAQPRAAAFVMLPPLAERLVVPVPETPVHATAAAAATSAGGAGQPGAAAAPQQGAPAAAAPRALAGEPLALAAAVDSFPTLEIAPLPAVETAAVAVAETAPAAAGAAEPAPTYVPGAAAAAKSRGAGSSAGSAGAGVSVGHGGITIKTGGGRKRHPPRGMPGRGRW